MPDETQQESSRVLVGKIARLPKAIREELNRRMDDGEPASTILPWLNELPRVKKVLAKHFGGTPINHRNISNWRAAGYQRWREKQESIQELKWLRETASDFSHAGAGKLAHGAASLAAAWLLDYMRRVPPDKCSPQAIAQISFAAMTLLKGEQANEYIKLAEKRVLQRDEQLLLTRNRDQRNAITIGLRLLGDARAKEIEGSSHSYAEKIEMLGLHTFGEELWQARYVAETNDSVN